MTMEEGPGPLEPYLSGMTAVEIASRKGRQ